MTQKIKSVLINRFTCQITHVFIKNLRVVSDTQAKTIKCKF